MLRVLVCSRSFRFYPLVGVSPSFSHTTGMTHFLDDAIRFGPLLGQHQVRLFKDHLRESNNEIKSKGPLAKGAKYDAYVVRCSSNKPVLWSTE